MRIPSPMLATLSEPRFSPGWVYERKLDGMRCLAVVRGGRVGLFSRNGNSLDAAFPELVDAVRAAASADGVFDGEVVAFVGELTSFARLQERMHVQDEAVSRASGVEVFFVVFDVLELGGEDVRSLSLLERKKLLRSALEFSDVVRFSQHRCDGHVLLREACGRGWEGVVAKRADSPYVSRRSRDWLKFRCDLRQEFVIGGFTAPMGSRVGFGSLLLGYFDDEGLRFAGRVGTGFSDAVLESLHERLSLLVVDESPFVDDVDGAASFVDPVLVCEVAFSAWTRAGRLRHPRFLGLREDKGVHEVVRE